MREHVLRAVNSNRRVISVFLTLSVAIYLILRLVQGFPYIGPYFRGVVNIIRSDDNLSYDEKMLSEKGSKYLYSKKIMEITTDSSVVCFWAGDGDLDASIAAYFLYPRFTKEIAGSGKIALAQIAELGCTHVFFNKGKPDFNLKARRIFLFSEKFEDSPVIVNSQLYLYENHEYLDKTGIIEL